MDSDRTRRPHLGTTRESLLAAVASRDAWTRAVSLEKLGRLFPDDALPHLIRAVSTRDPGGFGGGHDETVLAYALAALEGLGPRGRAAGEALEGALAADYRNGPDDWAGTRHKLAALCAVAGPEHTATFLRDLFDSLGKARREWAGTLLMFSATWAGDFAVLLADDPDPGVREEVALHRGTAPG